MRLFTNAMVLFGLISSIGCTRSIAPQTISLKIPFNESSSSSLAVGDKLHFAVINIQGPGRPTITKQFEFENNPVSWGTPLVLNVPGVPAGNNVLIQFLGVYETSIGASYLITYGDVMTNITTGETIVNIAPTAAGTANKEGRVSGRFFSDDAGGPTGKLGVFFNPPNGNPRMLIEKSSIIAGYFNIFVLDNIPLTYAVVESGTSEYTVFSNVTISSPALAGPNVFRASIPTVFEIEEKNGVTAVRQRPPSEEFIGFFGAAGVAAGIYAGLVHYAGTGYTEGLEGLYGAVTIGGKLINPVVYMGSGGTASNARPAVNGTSSSYNSLMTHTLCPPGAPGCFNFYHHRLSDHDASGINPPFALVDPFSKYGGYLQQSYSSGPNQMTLKWKYLANAAPLSAGSGYDGVEILYMESSGGGSYGGGHQDCNDLKMRGYRVDGVLSGSLAETYTVQGSAIGLTAANHYNFQFLVCPYKSDAQSPTGKSYVGNHIRSSCSGSCGDNDGFGWGSSSGSVSTNGDAETKLGIRHARVSGVNSGISPFFTEVPLATSIHPFAAADIGKEVMFIVQGQRNNTDCGQFIGQNIQVGMKANTRILDYNTSILKIPKGTFMDELNPSNLANPMSGTTSCYVQAVLVPHFQDLTFLGTVTIASFAEGPSGGGVMAFRVSGMLSIAGGISITANGSGYLGGGGTSSDGGGTSNGAGLSARMPSSSGGGAGSFYAGGGSGPHRFGGKGIGASAGAFDGARGEAAFGGGMMGGGLSLAMGGGGGGIGGAGGGIIYIAGREIIFGSGAPIYVSAIGGNSGVQQGGGGAGGTVAIVAGKAVGSATVLAKGGSSSASFNSGGAGGGGTFLNLICDRTGLTLPEILSAGIGPVPTYEMTTSPNGAQDGFSEDANDWNLGNPSCRN